LEMLTAPELSVVFESAMDESSVYVEVLQPDKPVVRALAIKIKSVAAVLCRFIRCCPLGTRWQAFYHLRNLRAGSSFQNGDFAYVHVEGAYTADASPFQLFRDEFVKQRRVGLAFGGFHHLANEETGDGLLAEAVLLHLLGVSGDYLVDERFDG